MNSLNFDNLHPERSKSRLRFSKVEIFMNLKSLEFEITIQIKELQQFTETTEISILIAN